MKHAEKITPVAAAVTSLATLMKKDARPPQPTQDCCTRSGILWDLAAVYAPGSTWSHSMPAAVIFNGPVVHVVGAIEAVLVPVRLTSTLATHGLVPGPFGRIGSIRVTGMLQGIQ
jgi:hypothetical protein